MKIKIAIEKDGKQYYADGDKVFSWLMERYSKYQGRTETTKAVLPYDESAWLDDMRKAFPGVDINNELDKAKAWLLSNKAHKKDLKKFCYNWISKATPSFTPQTRTNADVRRDRKRYSQMDSYTKTYGNERAADVTEIGDLLKSFKLGDNDD